MKKIFYLTPLLAIMLIISCKKEKEEPIKGKGFLELSINMQIIESQLNKLKSIAVATDNFKVTIYNASNEIVVTYDNAIDMPELIELDAGEYYVEASQGNYNDVGFDLPCYYGRSDNFVVDVESTTNVEMFCEIANCAVSINYSAQIKNDFIDFYAIVSSVSGSLTYDSSETRNGYFPLEKLNIQAVFSYKLLDNSIEHKILEGTIEKPQAGKLYEINLDASLSSAKSAISITADDELETVSLVLSETHSDLSGAQYGDIIITEVMYDPESMSETYGEWIEIYNTTSDTINLNNLVIRKSTSKHVIDSNLYILPNEYLVLAKTDSATGTSCYVYGSITLNNTGCDLGIYTYGTDGTDGNEICSIEYDDGGTFPDASGATISLSPDYLNVDDAKSGENWCLGTEVYSTGDLGSPGVENQACE